jgi:glycosyltransferase involved in cell wall biosynthesis
VLTGYFSPAVSAFFRAIERALAGFTTCLIAVSEEVRADLVRLRVAPPERILVLPLGFDFSRFDVPEEERRERREAFRRGFEIPLDAPLVTLVGRLEPIKRVDRFLRVANLIEEPEETRFLVVGDGALREQLQQSPEASRLGDRLFWAGLRSDMPDVYFASDALAVTSDNEGTAVSAIEAQATGLPVVTTRVGGMPTVVDDGNAGLLVEPEDEQGFAAALERVLVDDGLKTDLGQKGAERARLEFSLDRLVGRIDALYQRLLAEAPVANVTFPSASGRSATKGERTGDARETVDTASAIRAALTIIRCIECRGSLELTGTDALRCGGCGHKYPIVAGSPVMVRPAPGAPSDPEAVLRRRTAESFAYEWEHFGELRPEWEWNFRQYIRPHTPESLSDCLVLDVGAGSGRHSYEARRFGARVVAVDVGEAIHVARRNLPTDVVTVQADAEELPFADAAFDLVMAIGVLHHLPDPRRALKSLARLVRPGGYIHVYLYWIPSRRWHRLLLRLVAAVRRVTTRLPSPVLRVLCYPIAAVVFTMFVLPYRLSRRVPRLRRVAAVLPLKAYANYPFKVCVNDQFDRFSAPLEWRFTADDVEEMLRNAGFSDIVVLDNDGWIGSGRRSAVAALPGMASSGSSPQDRPNSEERY